MSSRYSSAHRDGRLRTVAKHETVYSGEGSTRGLFGGKKRKRRLEEAGVDAQAVLVSFLEVGQQNFTPLVDLRLRITPAGGSGPFEVTARRQVPFSQVGKLAPG